MKVLYLTDYFYPFAHGGAEWSIYYLAQSLIKRGYSVSVMTPDYGSKKNENWHNISIFRFPFPIKLNKDNLHAVNPFWFTNIIFLCVSTWHLLKIIRKLKPDVLHLQSHYYLPAVWLVSKIHKISFIITLRDYQLLCPFGFCLTQYTKYRKCNIKRFFLNDIIYYFTNYLDKSYARLVLVLSSSLRIRLINHLYRYFLKKAVKLVCISKKQESIYNLNNLLNTLTIYNSINIKLLPKNNKKQKNQLIFIGRLTPGKGIDILISSFIKVLKKDKNLKLIIIGQGFLKSKLLKVIKKNKLSDKIILMGQLSHQKALQSLSRSKLCIVPSVWEEPFGRVALESLFLGIPVVATNRGGLPEIVNNGVTGYIVEPTIPSISFGIQKALNDYLKLKSNIKLYRRRLNNKFNYQVVDSYIKLYQSL